jgi:hypothetical protein
MIIELLGSSLGPFRMHGKRRINPLLMIADHIIARIQHLHTKHVIQRAISHITS